MYVARAHQISFFNIAYQGLVLSEAKTKQKQPLLRQRLVPVANQCKLFRPGMTWPILPRSVKSATVGEKQKNWSDDKNKRKKTRGQKRTVLSLVHRLLIWT
ncbi:unnamed protein product, partial [Nezara viridula]